MKKILIFKYVNDEYSILDFEFYYITLLNDGTILLPDYTIISKFEFLENHYTMFYDLKSKEIHKMTEYEEETIVLKKLIMDEIFFTDENQKSIKYFVKYNYLEEIRRNEEFEIELKKNKIMF